MVLFFVYVAGLCLLSGVRDNATRIAGFFLALAPSCISG